MVSKLSYSNFITASITISSSPPEVNVEQNCYININKVIDGNALNSGVNLVAVNSNSIEEDECVLRMKVP